MNFIKLLPKGVVLSILASISLYAMEEHSGKHGLSSSAYHSLSKAQQPTLDTLPPDVLGAILSQLTAMIGTPSIKNLEDLKVVIKNIKRLACVNKSLNKVINNDAVTNQLVLAVAKRFKMSPLEAAVTLNTQSSRRWLEGYVQESGEYDLFKQVQKLHTLALEAVEEVKKQGLVDSIPDGRSGWPEPNPFYNQTKQGLFLDIGSYPDHLYTPWGKIALLGGGCGRYSGFLAVSQAFLRKIQATLEYVQGHRERGIKFYKVIKPIKGEANLEDCMQKISFEESQSLKGQEVLVVSNLCGCSSIYKINKINDSNEALPAPEDFIDEREFRSYEVVEMLWKIMMGLYRKELGTTFALEEYTKEMDRKVAEVRAKKEATDEKACGECKNSGCSLKCSQCKQVYYCSKTCQVNNWPLHKALCFVGDNNPLLELNQKIRTIDDIPTWLACLVNLLYNQPLFNGKGSMVKECKVLPWGNRTDCRLCEVLTDCAKKEMLVKKSWSIHDFNGNLYTSSGKHIPWGITLWLYDSDPLCDLSSLKEAYTSVISKIKEGWSFASLENYDDILHKESEEEWQLLIKNEYLSQEGMLIHCIAAKCGLLKKVRSATDMKSKSNRKVLYVWVKKEVLEQFIRTFGCKFINTKL